MSNFINDNSTQLSYIPTLSFSYNTISNPDINFNGTSGIYNSTSNTIIIFTSQTSALTIDSNQCIYGNGTGLTHLQYTNIDNKPSNFQSDWNTTVLNNHQIFSLIGILQL